MDVNVNVTIPLSLLKSIIILFEYFDTSLLDFAAFNDYWDVLSALKLKLLKLDLREAYSKIITAPNQDARDIARIEYLKLKNLVVDASDPNFSQVHN